VKSKCVIEVHRRKEGGSTLAPTARWAWVWRMWKLGASVLCPRRCICSLNLDREWLSAWADHFASGRWSGGRLFFNRHTQPDAFDPFASTVGDAFTPFTYSKVAMASLEELYDTPHPSKIRLFISGYLHVSPISKDAHNMNIFVFWTSRWKGSAPLDCSKKECSTFLF
jgi:hypothetical protein